MLAYHVGDKARYRRGGEMATMQGLEGNNLENKTKYRKTPQNWHMFCVMCNAMMT